MERPWIWKLFLTSSAEFSNPKMSLEDEILQASFVYGQHRRRLQVQPLAQASEFYVPNGNADRIVLTTNGHPISEDGPTENW